VVEGVFVVVGARVVVGLAVVVGGTVVVVGGNVVVVVVGGGVVVVTTVVEGCASNSESPDLLHPAINTTATSSPATVLMPHVTSRPAGQPEGPRRSLGFDGAPPRRRGHLQ
jgi:hypothetical protein